MTTSSSTPVSMPAALLVVGANHRSSARAVRERLSVETAEVPRFLKRLAAEGIGQALVLSTSERVEVFAIHEAPRLAATAITGVLAGQAGMDAADLSRHLYVFEGEEAVRHLFAVAASLDSVVIGEPQILDQLCAAQRLAREHGMLGPELEGVAAAAVRTAQRVRAETGLADRPASIAAAAVQISHDIHGDLEPCSALVLGPGDMGELLAAHLRAAGLGTLVLAGRWATRVEQASTRLKSAVIPLDDLEDALHQADIVIASVGIGAHLIAAPMMAAALKRRRRRPVFLIDAAVPGDIDHAVGGLDGAFLYDLDDLERVVMEGGAKRAAAAAAAQGIVEDEVAAMLHASAGSAREGQTREGQTREGQAREGPDPVARRRRQLESLRRSVLSDLGDTDAEAATQALIDRLLRDEGAADRDKADPEGHDSLDARDDENSKENQ